MKKPIDLTGQKFGRLTVIEHAGKGKGYQTKWLCQCICGNITIVLAGLIKNGHTQSCGCLQKERASQTKKIHGCYKDISGKRTRLSRVWSGMKERCQNEHNKGYKYYGGRGIRVCEDWQQYGPFHKWALANGYQEGLSIERIDVDGNYCPENCTWIPFSEQAKNKRTTRR